MSKYITLLFVVAFAAVAIAEDSDDDSNNDDLFSSVGGLFSNVFQNLEQSFQDNMDMVRNMKTPDGANSDMHSSSSSSSKSESYVNGQLVSSKSDSDKLSNDNGVVTEEHHHNDQ